MPRLPVPAEQFADPAVREHWRLERNLVVFSFHDPTDPRREVDLFTAEPMPFEQRWDASASVTLSGIPVRVACIDHLIAMKRVAGRPQDQADIVALQALAEDTGTHDDG